MSLRCKKIDTVGGLKRVAVGLRLGANRRTSRINGYNGVLR